MSARNGNVKKCQCELGFKSALHKRSLNQGPVKALCKLSVVYTVQFSSVCLGLPFEIYSFHSLSALYQIYRGGSLATGSSTHTHNGARTLFTSPESAQRGNVGHIKGTCSLGWQVSTPLCRKAPCSWSTCLSIWQEHLAGCRRRARSQQPMSGGGLAGGAGRRGSS